MGDSSIDVDVAVIGAGTAGLAAYRAAVAAGCSAVIIEGGAYGTTCARVGCMPSKLLIAAAEAAHAVERWPAFGLRLDGELRVDGAAVMARVRRERDRFVGFVLAGVERLPAAAKVSGHARFTGAHSLLVDNGPAVHFHRAVIATGSSPHVPPVLHAAGERVIVNDDVFDWEDLPRRVAVVGAGVIGLELGQALHRLGVDVRMLGRNHRLGPFTDPVVRAYATRTFQAELALDTNVSIREARPVDDGVEIAFTGTDGTAQSVIVDYVIAAAGRRPNVHQLDLERTGIALDEAGVPIFDRQTLQCGDSDIFIAGDANDDVPLLHEAADEGRIAGENAARSDAPRPGRRRVPLAIVFSEPQIAVVGVPRASLPDEDIVTGTVSFEDQGRSRVMLRNRGLLHLYADRAGGRILGAEMIAPDAEHLGHLLAWAIECELTVARTLQMPFYHPVVEEGLRTALREAQAAIDRAKSAPDWRAA